MKKRNALQRSGDRSIKLDVTFSIALHLCVLAATVVSSPFLGDHKIDLGEVIRVQLTAMPAASQPAPVQPLTVPTPVEETVEDIPMSDPALKEKVAVSEKKPDPPKKKPKPKPKKETPAAAKPPESQAKSGSGTELKEIDAPVTGEGSMFEGAKIDNESFDYPYWFTQAFNKINSNFRNPIAYDGTLVCVVYFQVIRSGRMLDVKVETSSGIEAFDNACLIAVERSAPFPPLPKGFRDEIIGLTLPVKWTP